MNNGSNTQNKLALPTILVMFGATGDLVRRKIVPALFHLYEHDRLPQLLQVIGYARRPHTDEKFRDEIRADLAHHKIRGSRQEINRFLSHFFYQRGNFNRLRDYRALAARLGRIDDDWRVCANKLFYLAVPPQFYRTLFTNLARSGLTIPCDPNGGPAPLHYLTRNAEEYSGVEHSRNGAGWTRVIVEKPFGDNARSARALDELLGRLFREEQIYRIDHYLAKEMLQNILTFRFSNNLLEENWSNRAIERIEIRLLETIGVEDRGAFYDGVGALRDVGQNHLLQMLALVTMERPDSFSAEAIRRGRANILSSLIQPAPPAAARNSTRAQYLGYRDIVGARTDSMTETYFRLETELASPRWQGVPIILEAGKRLGEVRKEIVVTFRHPRPCLCPTPTHYRNQITFRLEPREAITIDLWAKKPGFEFAVEERDFDFTLKQTGKRRQYVEEYAKLLLDCILGDQTLFVSTEEVTAMWRATDPFLRVWARNQVPLLTYQPGTDEAVTAAVSAFDTSEVNARLPARQGHRLGGGTAAAMVQTKAIGMIGLGKMGGNLARQLLEKEWQVVGWDPKEGAATELAAGGLTPAADLAGLVRALPTPRVVWLMIPAGAGLDETIAGLLPYLERGDTIIDGGNSYYEDSARRARRLKRRGIQFLDAGVSGGPSGARTGAVLLVGGNETTYRQLLSLFRDLAAPGGLQFFPGSGAGHFVKMIHNGIEYGIMQAIAEGFEILRAAPYRLDLLMIADVYNHGSVIESRLIGWLGEAFRLHGEDLIDVSGAVGHTGEGQWTVETAKKLKLQAKIIEGALSFRKQSAKNPSYAGKILSALREQFGGHSVKQKKERKKVWE